MFVIVYDEVTVLGTWKVQGLSQEAFTESQMIFIPDLAPLHHGCVTVGKSLLFSEPKFSSLYNGIIVSPFKGL